jgi:hypothetical protein
MGFLNFWFAFFYNCFFRLEFLKKKKKKKKRFLFLHINDKLDQQFGKMPKLGF